jgi:hypothetical protein
MQSACAEAIGVLFGGQYSEVEFRVVVSSKKRINEEVLETENILRQFSGMKVRLLDENQQGSGLRLTQGVSQCLSKSVIPLRILRAVYWWRVIRTICL